MSNDSNEIKTIDTLVADIYGLFGKSHECDPTRVENFAKGLATTVSNRLSNDRSTDKPTLRMSNLGKPDRQLWYDINSPGGKEEFEPHTLIKFLYGDILEALLLFLAEESGHVVTHSQEEVEVDGVVGHMDAVIDGVVVDVKSASTYSFKKFRDGSLREDDPFGYMEQLAAYGTGLGGLPGGFLAIDKTLGHITFMGVEQAELEALNTRGRIEHIKEVLEGDEAPDRCYEPVPDGVSGNMKLDTGCSYCSHKFKCWADANNGIGLRTFLYSGGPRHLTVVANEPRTPELTF